MICAPVQCCCAGPWSIAPGEVQPLTLDVSDWLGSRAMGGFTLASVGSASLMDYTVNPPQAADDTKIRIVSGLPSDPTPGNNLEASGLVNLMPTYQAVRVMIAAAPSARIGSQYRLDICIVARDCDGIRAQMCGCVTIVVAECR